MLRRVLTHYIQCLREKKLNPSTVSPFESVISGDSSKNGPTWCDILELLDVKYYVCPICSPKLENKLVGS